MRSGMAAPCLCLVLFAAACGPRAEQGGGKSQSAAEQSPSPSGALETAAPAETEAAEAPATPEPTPAPTPTIPALAGPVTYEGQVDFFGVGESTLTFTMSADRMRLYDIALDYGDYARPDSFDDMGGFVTRSLPGGQYLYPAEIPAEEPGRFAVGSGSRALTLEVTCTDT